MDKEVILCTVQGCRNPARSLAPRLRRPILCNYHEWRLATLGTTDAGPARKPWSEANENTLRAHWSDFTIKSVKELAAIMGVSEMAIRGKARRLNLGDWQKRG